jgi:hypothetical protein
LPSSRLWLHKCPVLRGGAQAQNAYLPALRSNESPRSARRLRACRRASLRQAALRAARPAGAQTSSRILRASGVELRAVEEELRKLTQPVPVSVLQIEVRNVVRYNEDLSDVTKFASNPSATPPTLPRNFYEVIHIGDIIAVNGSPARGTYITRLRNTNTMLNPNPGEAVADTSVAGLSEVSFDILTAEGRPIGSLFGMGLSRSTPAPGAPSAVTTGNHIIVGGSGAFLGARGYFGQAVSDQTVPIRNASIAEDPANRRKNGGGRIAFLIEVIPYIVPQIVTTSGGLAVFHSV